MPSRRRLLAVGAAVLSAGCPALPTGDGSPSGDTPTPNGTGPTPNDPAEECQPSTPEPTPDLSVTNDADDAVTATVTVRRAEAVGGTATPATDGTTSETPTTGDPLYEQSHALESGETVDVDGVLPEQGTYRVTVAVATGADGSADVTTESATVEGGPTRYGLVSVRIERADAVDVGWLHVVPPATPTPCP